MYMWMICMDWSNYSMEHSKTMIKIISYRTITVVLLLNYQISTIIIYFKPDLDLSIEKNLSVTNRTNIKSRFTTSQTYVLS
jgi:hypothetical protein